MKLKVLFTACSRLCRKKAEEQPNSGFKCNEGKFTYTQIAEELDKLKEWCYPLDTTKLKIHLECCDCAHYKKFRHRDRAIVMLCELDKSPKDKTHYCGYAVPKKEKQE